MQQALSYIKLVILHGWRGIDFIVYFFFSAAKITDYFCISNY